MVLLVVLLNAGILALAVVLLLQVRDLRRNTAPPSESSLSLRDVIAALDRASVLAEGVALKLQPAADVARAEFGRLVILIDRLESKITAGGLSTARIEASGARLEKDRAAIADALVLSDAKVQGVADNLADSQQAARDTRSVHPGDQADAAAIGKPRRPAKPRAPKK